jgi:hypothetical protein
VIVLHFPPFYPTSFKAIIILPHKCGKLRGFFSCHALYQDQHRHSTSNSICKWCVGCGWVGADLKRSTGGCRGDWFCSGGYTDGAEDGATWDSSRARDCWSGNDCSIWNRGDQSDWSIDSSFHSGRLHGCRDSINGSDRDCVGQSCC